MNTEFRNILGEWVDVVDKDILKTVLERLKTEYAEHTIYPVKQKVFRMFRMMKLENIKVIVLGQDAYPGLCKYNLYGENLDPEPYAQGIAFSVKENMKPTKSLQIILDSVTRQFYNGVEIPPSSPSLIRWVEQGVFLLNTALTVKANEPNSHKELWSDFTKDLIMKISSRRTDIIYLLWGKEAQIYTEFIAEGYVLKDVHPNSVTYNPELKFNGCFQECNILLESLGKEKINW